MWLPVAARYNSPDPKRGWAQLATSFLPYFVTWALMYWSLQSGHYWLTLLLALPAAGFLTRVFIIQHDCGHGSFLPSRKLMDWLGTVAGFLTLVPYEDWRRSHAIHHAGAGRLSDRGVGDIPTLTVREYLARGRVARLRYRIFRHPLVMFGVGPFVLFGLMYRFPYAVRGRSRETSGVLVTNAAIFGLIAILGLTLGFRNFFMIQGPITMLSCTAGVWLFYVQHQFENTYWSDGTEWCYTSAALRGSSFYRLPRLLQWFAGNIGFHHIHHLSPRIPNYHLERCHRENPMFQEVPTLTLLTSLRSIPLALWDEDERRLVSFGHLRRKRAA